MTPEQIGAKIADDLYYFGGNSVQLRDAIATALRQARNEALEEAALYADVYEGSRFGYVVDHHEISSWLRELKHKDGQP